jgi:hypothetical protein
MTATPSLARRSRAVRAVAVGATLSVAATAVALAGAGPAAAATTPYAQSVGRFLDGSAGGRPIQSIADLKDARATAPGSPSQQNPLAADLGGQAEVPIGHALQLPGGGAFHLGAVNQVAKAHNNGAAYGASGAVSNSGAISSGGNNNAYPADAKIDLSDQSLGSVGIPGLPKLPGVPGVPGGSQPALGGVSADIGAISAVARTKAGGTFATPRYKIASLALVLNSPALAALLNQLAQGGQQLQGALDTIEAALKKTGLPVTFPSQCQPDLGSLPATITLDHGAVVVDPSTAAITVNLGALLRTLGVKLNSLPPNTDLLAYVLNNLGRILSHGLAHVVNGLINPIKNLGTSCTDALSKLPGIGALIKTLISSLTTGQATLEKQLQAVADQLSAAGAPGLKQLTDNLAKVIALGVNVQQGTFPLSSEPSPTYKFTSALVSTPDQATATVPGQGVVRALEIDIAGSQGAALALGNAAAGPSSSPAPVPTSSVPPTGGVPSTQIPTGVPAGAAADNGGSSALPLIVLLVVLTVGGGGAVAFRSRGRFTR